MATDTKLRCQDCNMTFHSHTLLHKHKAKFCLGGKIGDPHQLLYRHGNQSAADQWRASSPWTPPPRPLSDSNYQETKAAKMAQLAMLKFKKSKLREIQDLQDRNLLLSIKPWGEPPDDVSSNPTPDATASELRKLSQKYEDLQDKEQDLYDQASRTRAFSTHTAVVSRASTNSSMSIHLPPDQDDYQSRQINTGRASRQRELQIRAEHHGRNMADINARGQELERQKKDISRRLEELNLRNLHGSPVSGANRLIEELRNQEEKNRQILQDLKRQLSDIRAGCDTQHPASPFPDIDLELFSTLQHLTNLVKDTNERKQERYKGVDSEDIDMMLSSAASEVSLSHYGVVTKDLQIASQIENSDGAQELNKQVAYRPVLPEPSTADRPGTSQNSLKREISAMRQAYLERGGNDPGMLAQMADMETEAKLLAERKPHKKHRPKDKEKYEELNGQIAAFELENQRLQEEVDDMQQRNRQRHLDKDDVMGFEVKQLRKDYLNKVVELQQEMELLRQQIKLERYRKDANPDPVRQSVTPRYQPPPPQPDYRDAEMPALMQARYAPNNLVDSDNLAPAPYDPNAGFMVFYDFVMGLEASMQSCRLVVSLYNKQAQSGDPTILPTVYCEPVPSGYYHHMTNMAFIGARQPVPRCPPSDDLGLVLELQVADSTTRLSTRAWCKLDLFDNHHRLISGRWKMPLRVTPLQPSLPVLDLNTIPQFGFAEVYIRLVNFRDADAQSHFSPQTINAGLYKYPPQTPRIHNSHPSKTHYIPPPPSVTPPRTPDADPYNHYGRSASPNRNQTLGLQVDRVKHAEPGEAKVRITAYCKNSGKVVQSSTSPVTCSTTAVKSNFKHRYHVFGQQEATFHDFVKKADMVLVIRFYLRQRAETSGDQFPDQQPQEIKMYDDETLVAWASMPLMVSAVQRHTPMGCDMRLSDDIRTLRMNTGTHRLQLFRPPVPEVDRIPLEEHWRPKEWERYGRANIRLNIFEGNPRPGSLTPSEASEDEEENLPEFAWISHERLNPPSEPYNNTDGFDVYIDGCRNLPDAVTVTKIAGRVLDRKYAKVGRDINTNVRLDSDIYNPIYNYKVEYREPNIPATATLLLKMYTVDKMYKQLIVAGYATLNIFVESGTERQPINNQGGVQVSLNEGCHQIRLYQYGPNGIDALTEACLRQAHVRHIPCATLLLRIIRAPIGPQGKPLESERIPQADWGRLGLWYPRPSYKDRLYFSMKCVPTKGESKLFHTLMRRPRVSIREAVHMIADERESRMLRSDKSVEAYVRDRLTKGMDMIPMDIDLTFIAQYSPKHGIKFSLDKAMNLPWSGFTMGHFCLNPPAAFYMGQPYASYDKLTFTDTLDLNSLNTAPVWFGGFMHFPNRSYHRFLTMVIHLQELSVTVGTDSYKYGLMEQAWTAVQMFSDGYAQTKRFQLPLFLGNPTQQMLRQLAREPCKLWIQRSLNNGTVRAAEGASVFVRLCDARRDEELSSDVPEKYAVEVDTDYVPSDKEAEYTSSVPGKPLITLVPQGKTPAEFADNLAVKFRSLVYKLYEDGSLNAR